MAEPIPAQKAPFPITAMAWRACCRRACRGSMTQPLCDGTLDRL